MKNRLNLILNQIMVKCIIRVGDIQRYSDMKKLCVLFILFLTACSSFGPHVEYLYEGPYGAVYEAYCNGNANTIGKCYQVAAKTCNGNFKIMDKSQNTNKMRVYNSFGVGSTSVDKYSTTTRNLIFYCQK